MPIDETVPLRPMPVGVLMAQPQHFQVVDVKNPFMAGNVGSVDLAAAAEQWNGVRTALASAGLPVSLIGSVPGCEDMVFTANPAICGVNARNERVCVLSKMRHPSRQREVSAHAAWYESNGYRVVTLDDSVERFEGGGDAVWHPGRALLWIGAGPRTSIGAHAAVGRAFDATVVALELATDSFYHLDTCFCAVDERTVLIYPPAFASSAIARIRDGFADVIEVIEMEASALFACNAAACPNRTVVIQDGANQTAAALRTRGFNVVTVETSEFIKSGGSVYCMKAYLY